MSDETKTLEAADPFAAFNIVQETREGGKDAIPLADIPQSVKDAVERANADRAQRVIVGPMPDKVMATRFAGLAQAYGAQRPDGRITVRATVRDDHSVSLTAADYVKRTLEQETKDKMRIAKLEKSVEKAKASGVKADITKANKALADAKAEIAKRDAAEAA